MYYIVYGFLWLISLLPLRVLYFLSDCIYGLVFHVFKYRRAVVLDNLKHAFPGKSERERMTIAKKFYHNLIDTFIESIKMISVSKHFIDRRFKANWEVVNDITDSGRSVQIHAGHNFNWEWANVCCTIHFKAPFLAVYMPISSKILNRLFYHLRSRNGTKLLSATNMRQDFLPYRNTKYILGLAADQNAGNPASGWWVNFLGRPAPFVKGPAKNAIANNTAIVYAQIIRVRRGYYEVNLTEATLDPRASTEQQLTVHFAKFVEDIIRQHPEMWLWSHRRWKWQWKPEYGEIVES